MTHLTKFMSLFKRRNPDIRDSPELLPTADRLIQNLKNACSILRMENLRTNIRETLLTHLIA